MIDIQDIRPLNKTDSPPPPSDTLPHPPWNVDWSDLMQVVCRQPQLLWVCECNSPATCRRPFLSQDALILGPIISLPPLPQGSLSLVGGVIKVPLWGDEHSTATYSLLLDYLWFSQHPTTHRLRKLLWEWYLTLCHPGSLGQVTLFLLNQMARWYLPSPTFDGLKPSLVPTITYRPQTWEGQCGGWGSGIQWVSPLFSSQVFT